MGVPLRSLGDLGSLLQYVSDDKRKAVEELLSSEAIGVPDKPGNAPAAIYSAPGGYLGKVGDHVWSSLWCRVPNENYRRLILHCDEEGFRCEFQRYRFYEPMPEPCIEPDPENTPLPIVKLSKVESKKRAKSNGAGLYAYVPKRFKYKKRGTDDRVFSKASKSRTSRPMRWFANAIGRKP